MTEGFLEISGFQATTCDLSLIHRCSVQFPPIGMTGPCTFNRHGGPSYKGISDMLQVAGATRERNRDSESSIGSSNLEKSENASASGIFKFHVAFLTSDILPGTLRCNKSRCKPRFINARCKPWSGILTKDKRDAARAPCKKLT